MVREWDVGTPPPKQETVDLWVGRGARTVVKYGCVWVGLNRVWLDRDGHPVVDDVVGWRLSSDRPKQGEVT